MPHHACWHCGAKMTTDARGTLTCPECGWWVPGNRLCGRCGDILVPDTEEPDQLYCLRCGTVASAQGPTTEEIQAVWREETRRARGAPHKSSSRRRRYGRKPVRMLPWYRRWGQ